MTTQTSSTVDDVLSPRIQIISSPTNSTSEQIIPQSLDESTNQNIDIPNSTNDENNTETIPPEETNSNDSPPSSNPTTTPIVSPWKNPWNTSKNSTINQDDETPIDNNLDEQGTTTTTTTTTTRTTTIPQKATLLDIIQEQESQRQEQEQSKISQETIFQEAENKAKFQCEKYEMEMEEEMLRLALEESRKEAELLQSTTSTTIAAGIGAFTTIDDGGSNIVAATTQNDAYPMAMANTTSGIATVATAASKPSFHDDDVTEDESYAYALSTSIIETQQYGNDITPKDDKTKNDDGGGKMKAKDCISTTTATICTSSIDEKDLKFDDSFQDSKPSAVDSKVISSTKSNSTLNTAATHTINNHPTTTSDDATTMTGIDDMSDDFDEEMKRAIELSLKESQGNHDYGGTEDTNMSDMKLAAGTLTTEDDSFHHVHGEKIIGVDFDEMKQVESNNNDTITTTTGGATSAASTSTSIYATAINSPSKSEQLLSIEEMNNITKALREADENQELASLQLAMQLQQEEEQIRSSSSRQQPQQRLEEGSHTGLRTVHDDEFQEMLRQRKNSSSATTQRHFETCDDDTHEDDEQYVEEDEEGYRINSSSSKWKTAKVGMGFIKGPNGQLRTKHDVQLKNESNAERLLEGKQNSKHDSDELPASSYSSVSSPYADYSSPRHSSQKKLAVSDVAYNSYHKSMKKINSSHRSTVKGVAAHGRAEKSFEKTRGGAMDNNTRLIISKAINNGLIQACNGVVKEGKEAIVYHADGVGVGSVSIGGLDTEMKFDVAIKVFKRVQEFKGRGSYVDGDNRYHKQKFKTVDKRKQVELWCEKEYRNLIRASRAGVAVPTPIECKENILFMRFLGEGVWPCPQLREVEIKNGSSKWTTLYCQTMVSIRKLYHCARLVHSDLSEYNILVCPMFQVENAFSNGGDDDDDVKKKKKDKDTLQIVLIDFGQAVERKHTSADEFLQRDLRMVNAFFSKKGIITLNEKESTDFILKGCDYAEDNIDEDNDDGTLEYECIDDDISGYDGSTDAGSSIGEYGSSWRHAIKGWDDEKDMESLGLQLTEKKIVLKTA